MESIVLYTDGGCSGNPGPGGWAFVIVRADGVAERGSGGERVTTNNRMELTAVCRGLEALVRAAGNSGVAALSGSAGSAAGGGAEAALPPGTIGVYTDSQYVQKGITQWIASWERNGWMTAGKEPVKNKDLWIELRKLSRSLPLTWHWVKGHAGNRWNEECDRMTQREIARFRH